MSVTDTTDSDCRRFSSRRKIEEIDSSSYSRCSPEYLRSKLMVASVLVLVWCLSTVASSFQYPMKTLGEVLSTCIDAVELGCEEIRRVDAKRRSDGVLESRNKELGNPRSAVTEADVASQAAIVGALRSAWPDLRIVGEEDDAADLSFSGASPRRRYAVSDDTSVAIEELTVYVDPLDGTREFVEGRLKNVQCLVGISRGGRALAGVVGLPFEDRIVYGTRDKVWGLEKQKSTRSAFAAGDGPYKTVACGKEFCATLLNQGSLDVGGTGAKLLMVAEGEAAVAMTHTKTMSWDTCAMEAIVSAAGGRVTDYFGCALSYEAPRRNALGVVASGPGFQDVHDRLCRHLRGQATALSLIEGLDVAAGEGQQAVDLARDLDRQPFETSGSKSNKRWLLGDAVGYSVPESDSIRGLMSTGCRLRYRYSRAAAEDDEDEERPSSAFYKRVAFNELDYFKSKSALKIARDVKSYAVEAKFLSSSALDGLDVAVAKAYASDLRPCESRPRDSSFALLLRDFDPRQGWYQRNLVDDLGDAEAALGALAKFHAHFWSKEVDGVWERGSYWDPQKQDPDQLTSIAESWPRHFEAFGLASDLADLGARLQPVAISAAADAHDRPQQTVIHGDPKAANFFFRDGEAGLIDFQWTGYGRVANDVGHFLCAAVDADVLDSHETHLLDHYYQTLVGRGAATDYGRDEFQADYETAVLDTCRLVFAYQWNRIGASPETLSKFKDSAGRNAYNKNLPNALWLVGRCDQILKNRN